jgi:hypothetical protein
MPSAAPRTLAINPRFARGNRWGVWFFGIVALLHLGLPLVPTDGRVRALVALWLCAAFGVVFYGGIAWLAYRTTQRLPRSAVAFDDDGVWPAHMAKSTALLRWGEIRSVRERRFRHRLELLDVAGRSRLTLDYYLIGFETLRVVLSERVRLTFEDQPLPARFTKRVSHHLYYVAALLALALLGVSLAVGGRTALGYGFMTLAVAVGLHEYLTTASGCVVSPGQLEIRYPLWRRVLRRDDVSAIRISDALKDRFGAPAVEVLAGGRRRPIRLRALGVEAQSLYQLLERWKERGGA